MLTTDGGYGFDQMVSAGCQQCGSNSSIRLALWVGSRLRTSLFGLSQVTTAVSCLASCR